MTTDWAKVHELGRKTHERTSRETLFIITLRIVTEKAESKICVRKEQICIDLISVQFNLCRTGLDSWLQSIWQGQDGGIYVEKANMLSVLYQAVQRSKISSSTSQ